MAKGRKATPITEKLAKLADIQAEFLKDKEDIFVSNYMSKSDDKKLTTLTAYKFRINKTAKPATEKQELESIGALNSLFKAIKKDATVLSEKELAKLHSKLDSVKEFIAAAKIEAEKKESVLKAAAKVKLVTEKKAALEALKKEIEDLEK